MPASAKPAARQRVGLLFGGRSAEHDVSRLSAANILRALDPNRYDVIPIGIGRDGRWRLCDRGNGAGTGAPALEIPEAAPEIALIPGGGGEIVLLDAASAARPARLGVDLVLPVLHGPNGEDGTVQGALELAGIPFVGSGVLGSAAAMDKDFSKRLLREGGIPIVPFLAITSRSPTGYEAAAEALGSGELFVKPANMGSSVGVSRVRSAEEYARASAHAFRYDEKLLVERSVAGAREIECSVLEYPSGELRASPPGEIVPAAAHGFYTYDAKYIDPNGARLRAPAELPPALAERIGALALASFRTLGCEGLARVDFFLESRRAAQHLEEIFVNEVNTLPGFTAISMYPKLWEAAGLSQEALMDVLIAHALARHARRASRAQSPG
jgi:D-alanine-D-alanine ligase